MKLDHPSVKEMMKIVDKYDLEILEYQGQEGKISLKAMPGKRKKLQDSVLETPVKVEEAVPVLEERDYIISESIGKYYYENEKGKTYLGIGQEIHEGDVIGHVMSIGISTPLISNYSGVVEDILVRNGEIIDYGKKLIKIRLR